MMHPVTKIGAWRPGLLVLATALAACRQSTGLVLAKGDAKLTGVAPLTVSEVNSGSYNVDFGQVPVGSQSNETLVISNDGSAPLQILSVSAPSDPEFGLTLGEGTTLEEGANVSVPVSFKPFSAGAKSATLVITTDSQSTPSITLLLMGTGVNLDLGVNPKILDFGPVVVHSQKALNITVSNPSTLSLMVTPGPMQGNDATLFTISTASSFALPAGGMQTLQVTFSPLTASPIVDAFFFLTSTAGDNVTVTLKGIAAQSGLCVYDNPLDFNFVATGSSLTKTLKVVNCGNQNIDVSSATIVNPGTPQPVFSDVTASASLMPGQILDIPVTFQPINTALYTGELDIISTDNTGRISVALEGYGGGAQISCVPAVLDFGEAGVEFTTTLPVICTNTGTDVYRPDGQTIDPNAELSFKTLRMSNPAFTAAFDPPPTSGSESLTAGESVRIDVSYEPLATESDKGTLTIESNVTNPPAPPVIALSGSGIEESKCYYSLSPVRLNFGQVTPLVPSLDGFTVTNVGPNECLITGLSLTVDTDSAFTLPNGPLASQRLSPPSGGPYPTSLTIPVRFEPLGVGSYSGAVGFTITDPDGPDQLVNLVGESGSSCLVLRPNPLNFPTVGLSGGQFCQSDKLEFALENECQQDVVVSALGFSAGSPPFQILASPTAPFTVARGAASPPIAVGFKPTAAGKLYGSIEVTSDATAQPIVEFMNGQANNGSTQTDRFVQQSPQADILWVVDSDDENWITPEAYPWTWAPGTSFLPQLREFLQNGTGVDYQMGVTATELCQGGDQGNIEPCAGCHSTSYDGTSNAFFTTPSLADPANDLLNLLSNIKSDPCDPPQASYPGLFYTGEQYLASAQQTLAPNGPAALHNAGFLRSGAFLSLILVAGDVEDDYSPDPWQDYLRFFQGLKTDSSFFSVYFLIDPALLVHFYPHLTAMTKQTNGMLVDITDPGWPQTASLWDNVFASYNTFPLSGLPVPSSLMLYLGGPPPDQANGQTPGMPVQANNPDGSWNWKYDPATNAVIINGQMIVAQNGDPLFVEYTLACN